MSHDETPYVFKYPLLNRGLHFDFLRLRCGTETDFHERVSALRAGTERPRSFVALSEWDALVILPTNELYPDVLNEFYDNYGIDSKIAGTAGYFAYLWRHPLNENLDDKLNRIEKSGLAFVISLRFEDWVRREMGLGAEILFCDYLDTLVKDPALTAIVAHTFGWNDIVIVLHTKTDEKRLLALQSQIRLLKLEDIVPKGKTYTPSRTGVPMFAASYTHIVGGYDPFAEGKPILGNLADEVLDARLLVRVAPELEWNARSEIEKLSGGKLSPERMPTELGHYTFSADITDLLQDGSGGGTAMIVVDGLRTFIGKSNREDTGDPEAKLFNSYAETTTILRFRDPSTPDRPLAPVQVDEDIRQSVQQLRILMQNLPEQLHGHRGSAMTAHRFGTILTTLLDHLGDPIRSSVVRHITRFLIETPNITDLDRQDMEDLCQIAEYAMSQATDGIAQFQHDANALGLTGRGGYSRLVTAIENYVDDILLGSFGIGDKNFLITFGLNLGQLGSVAQFHIDIPFNVLFVPSRWYILLHEVGHMAWAKKFGWMAESLAIYDALEAEIVASKREREAPPREDVDIPMEFIRTRELIREIFPNMLVFFVACGADVQKFDRLSLRHLLSRSRSGRGARELLFAVSLSCMMRMTAHARREGGSWFARALSGDFLGPLDTAIRRSIKSVNDALDLAAQEEHPPHVVNTIKNKQALLGSAPFASAVTDTVNAVLRVMRILAKTLSNEKHLGKHLLDNLQATIDEMVSDYETSYKDWRNQGFDQWITNGRVLATAPDAHVWARLLFENREVLKKDDKTAVMRSQMAALLSIWHRAVVSPPKDDDAAVRVRKQILFPLDLIDEKVLA
jgi:hypothetical protein